MCFDKNVSLDLPTQSLIWIIFCLVFLLFHFQDQFDNLDKHTQWGIDFLERYAKFVKERLDIEQNYAKQLRYKHTNSKDTHKVAHSSM